MEGNVHSQRALSWRFIFGAHSHFCGNIACPCLPLYIRLSPTRARIEHNWWESWQPRIQL